MMEGFDPALPSDDGIFLSRREPTLACDGSHVCYRKLFQRAVPVQCAYG
jgi:hypothetical protein